MNNLITATLASAVGVALFCNTQRSIVRVNRATQAAEAQAKATATEASDAREEMNRIEKLLAVERDSITRLRAQLAAAETPAVVNEAELSPEKEGFWPAEKPYFYLSKTRLAGVGYSAFGEDDITLSRAARLLFGLSSEEESAVDAAAKMMREQLRKLEIARATPTNTPARLATWPGVKATFTIEAVSRDDITPVTREFKNALQQSIGPERAALLGRRIDEGIEESYSLLNARTLTLVRDGEHIQIVELDRAGDMNASRTTTPDGKEEVPRAFRHLFPAD